MCFSFPFDPSVDKKIVKGKWELFSDLDTSCTQLSYCIAQNSECTLLPCSLMEEMLVLLDSNLKHLLLYMD